MTKLVKQAVKLSEPIANIVIRDIHHVSSSTAINELSRVLALRGYALIDKTTLVTSENLLAFISAKLDVHAPKEEKTETEHKPAYFTIAAASVVAAGLATGAFLFAKKH